ncbi:hypothetical protein [Streptomyces huiliensis]|uniref:hypothetical protein n=1 Tax=Streptomyces huiliensis TaxID=2876027 RepID=UPI001CBA9EBF|nr:hypothetical protein [Streptomyces huiliensis]
MKATAGRRVLRGGAGVVGGLVLLFGGTPSAEAGANGCNQRTCVSVEGSGLRVERVSASTTWNGDFTGHFHIWGGGLDANSPTAFWGYHQKFTVPVGRDLPNRSVVCAEGWEHTSSGLQSRGRACEEIRF